MKKYKYVSFNIQDLSTGELVNTAHSYDELEDEVEISADPLTVTIEADDLAGIYEAKEMMNHALNSIYSCCRPVCGVPHVSVYIDNLAVYNINISYLELTIFCLYVL